MSKLSLNVVSAPRPDAVGSEPPSMIQLSEPMRRFRCNQKGCCCSGWDIPFRLEDFLRLNEYLPEGEREALTHGIRLVLEEKSKEGGEQVLHSLKLDGVGEDKACRFLAPGGACSVHAAHGPEALPDLCVDFPAFGYRRDDAAVELWFDPVCPEVLERLDESDAPLELHQQKGFFGDPNLDPRVQHTSDPIGGRLGKTRLPMSAIDKIRAVGVAAFADPARAPWRTLAALLHAYRRLRVGNEDRFELVEPEDTGPFLRFLGDSIGSHGADLLNATVVRYKRFIWSIDPLPLVTSPLLIQHLDQWQPAYAQWLAPQEDSLRGLMVRWMAHRFGLPMMKGRGELREAADGIVHVYATSLRIAAAMGAVLEKPVDRAIYKAALGASEFFYRSLNLPREALPWFASARE